MNLPLLHLPEIIHFGDEGSRYTGAWLLDNLSPYPSLLAERCGKSDSGSRLQVL